MKRFDFPLEKVRQWRNEQAGLEEMKLQRIYSELRAIDEGRKRVEEELAEASRQVRGRPVPEVVDLVNLDTFRLFTASRLLQIEDAWRKCHSQVEQQRQQLVEARRRFELLDKLKQKALANWRIARDKEEEELAGELFLAKRRREHRTSES